MDYREIREMFRDVYEDIKDRNVGDDNSVITNVSLCEIADSSLNLSYETFQENYEVCITFFYSYKEDRFSLLVSSKTHKKDDFFVHSFNFPTSRLNYSKLVEYSKNIVKRYYVITIKDFSSDNFIKLGSDTDVKCILSQR